MHSSMELDVFSEDSVARGLAGHQTAGGRWCLCISWLGFLFSFQTVLIISQQEKGQGFFCFSCFCLSDSLPHSTVVERVDWVRA